MGIGKDIRDARNKKGWNQTKLAEALNLKQATISDYESGKTPPPLDKLQMLVRLIDLKIPSLGVSEGPQAAFTAEPTVIKKRPQNVGFQVPLRGNVGAATRFMPFTDSINEYITSPIEPKEATEAVRIEGDSMLPAFPSGTTLYYSIRETNVSRFLNRTVICGLADGQILFKTIRKGGKAGTYTLESLNPNFEDINDAHISYILPTDYIEF